MNHANAERITILRDKPSDPLLALAADWGVTPLQFAAAVAHEQRYLGIAGPCGRAHRLVGIRKTIERMRVSDGFITTFILDPDAPPYTTVDTTNMSTVCLSDPALFTAHMVREFNSATKDYIFTLTEQEYDHE